MTHFPATTALFSFMFTCIHVIRQPELSYSIKIRKEKVQHKLHFFIEHDTIQQVFCLLKTILIKNTENWKLNKL